jgi:hypothetical protein
MYYVLWTHTCIILPSMMASSTCGKQAKQGRQEAFKLSSRGLVFQFCQIEGIEARLLQFTPRGLSLFYFLPNVMS